MITVKEREHAPEPQFQSSSGLENATGQDLTLTDQILHLFGLPGLEFVHRQTAIALGEGMDDDFDAPPASQDTVRAGTPEEKIK